MFLLRAVGDTAGGSASVLSWASPLGWLTAFVVLGVVLGGLVASVADMASDPGIVDLLEKLGGSAGTITDIYLSTELAFVAVAAAAAGISVALRLASEERAGRGEPVLATATSRRSWLGAHTLYAVALPVALFVAIGLAVAITSKGQGEAPGLGPMLAAALARVPAVLVMVAIAVLAAAAVPTHASALAWGALAVAFGLGELGATVGLPQWLIDVSPFAHVPPLPGGDFTVTPTVVLCAVAAVTTALAFAAYRVRDAA